MRTWASCWQSWRADLGLSSVGAGLRLAVLLGRLRIRLAWNRGWRKATTRRRLLSSAMLALGILALILLVWVPEAGLAYGLSRLDPQQAPEVALQTLVGLGLLGFTGVLLYGSLLFTLSALLLNRDLEVLLAAPWPVESVMAAKIWLRCLGLFALALGFTGPLLVLLPLFEHSLLLPPVMLLVLLVIPMLPVALVSLAAMALVRFVPAGRGREVIAFVGVLLPLGINVINLSGGFGGLRGGGRGRIAGSFNLPDIPIAYTPWLPHGWGAQAAGAALSGNAGAALGWTALLVAVSFAAVVVATAGMRRLYLAGWTETAAQSGRSRSAARRSRRRSRTRSLPSFGLDQATLAIAVKDLRIRRRDIILLVRSVVPFVFLALLAFRSTGSYLPVLERIGHGPSSALLALLPVPLAIVGITTALGLTAVSLEGASIWVYAVSPNPMQRLLIAKSVVAAVPVATIAACLAIVIEVLVRPGWFYALGAVLVATALASGLSVTMVALGGLLGRFDWTDPRRTVRPGGALLALVAQLAMIFALALALAIPLIGARLLQLPSPPAFGLSVLLGLAASAAAPMTLMSIAVSRLSALEIGSLVPEGGLT